MSSAASSTSEFVSSIPSSRTTTPVAVRSPAGPRTRTDATDGRAASATANSSTVAVRAMGAAMRSTVDPVEFWPTDPEATNAPIPITEPPMRPMAAATRTRLIAGRLRRITRGPVSA